MRSLPYPYAFRFFFPLVAPGVAIVHYARSSSTRRQTADGSSSDRGYAILLTATFSLLLLLQVSVRPDEAHLLPVYLCSLLLIEPCYRELLQRVPRAAQLSTAMALFLAVATLNTETLSERFELVQSLLGRTSHTLTAAVPRASGVLLAREQVAALAKVRELAHPTDAIFVGNTRHDRLHMNDSSFYFLSGLTPATYFHEMDPGTLPLLESQERVTRDHDTTRPRWAVLVRNLDDSQEPNASRSSSGVDVLDRYLRARFQEVAAFGDYVVMRARP